MTEDPIDLYARISHSRTADEVVQQIELLILEGVLRDGDRLPGERELSKRFDVSRPILREALKELETRGLVESRHGGGTFVADVVGQIFSKPLVELIGRHSKATQDYLEFRRELEGLTAELAATRATDFDRDILTSVIERMREAHRSGNFDEELEADIELHNAIGDSAHNIILLHTLRACYRLLTRGIFFHRSTVFGAPGARDRLLSQHEAIYAAIMARDPQAAKSAAQGHIDFVAAAAREAERSGEWARIAQMRLLQRDRSREP
ncbi:FadR/GntR family transcriptional regulator [Sinorhizobium alkalisoli]|uniref:Pyruvate dehydrogenase complex repressor n=1 Tax=Sinorhizobium alkalisoli TaxID=1752398 RepID=A0A1E3V7U2_9HYPH|nr:FadR/GntR family transcriptional regulator [Sinorhizobium alkalisoli]MCA1489479.1 FadR family transcriptional regulator [Ensifer sp. NBAIM29]MCG5479931.1 FadR family transcriptional regulator [Sinorhizobium alkalisoli]ODR88896.1 GntR family transcriptional regulator [Sinorhizobium alkalisoli]QFI65262.1 Glycolate utilization operon transcriptional activator GlcC [Sinorhizobium alkalisoli]